MPSTSSRAARSGRAPSQSGGANGVWWKWTEREVGPSWPQPRRDEAEVVVLHEHRRPLGAASATASAKAWFTAR